MNYEIIKDERILRAFIDWLPDLEVGEQFYVTLFARKKYVQDLANVRSDKDQLKRFTATKDRLLSKLQQLECPVGSYIQKGIVAPQEAMAVYITPNPRSLIKATKNSLVKLMDLFTRDYNGHNPQAEVMSEIQKAVSRKIWFDLDFDMPAGMIGRQKFYDILNKKIEGKINPEATEVLMTRGGFHLLVGLDAISEEFKRTWYKDLTSIGGCDTRGDGLIPIPGCTQGGFIPYFL